MNHTEIVTGVAFPADQDAPVIFEPGKESFYFPAAPVTPQNPAVLRAGLGAVVAVRRNQFHALLLSQALIERVAVVATITHHAGRRGLYETLTQRVFDQLAFMRRSTRNPYGDRNTMAVCNNRDLAPFAVLGGTHSIAPFFAPTKEASTKL
ncbi:MAG: hypothetical protein L0099_14355, partial [Acidobacteria bacterium]|nr:hypothetical protein [Acidobacteriota bacterium]